MHIKVSPSDLKIEVNAHVCFLKTWNCKSEAQRKLKKKSQDIKFITWKEPYIQLKNLFVIPANPHPRLLSLLPWGSWDSRAPAMQGCAALSRSVMSNSLWPHEPARLLCPWDSPGNNIGVGCHALLQGIFPTQGSNQSLPHCKQILYHLRHQGSPRILEQVTYPFSRGSSPPRNWTGVSCIAGGFFTSWATREVPPEHGSAYTLSLFSFSFLSLFSYHLLYVLN